MFEEMNVDSQKRAFLMAIISPLIFALLIIICVLTYNGGHSTEFQGSSYDFISVLPNYDSSSTNFSVFLNYLHTNTP